MQFEGPCPSLVSGSGPHGRGTILCSFSFVIRNDLLPMTDGWTSGTGVWEVFLPHSHSPCLPFLSCSVCGQDGYLMAPSFESSPTRLISSLSLFLSSLYSFPFPPTWNTFFSFSFFAFLFASFSHTIAPVYDILDQPRMTRSVSWRYDRWTYPGPLHSQPSLPFASSTTPDRPR